MAPLPTKYNKQDLFHCGWQFSPQLSVCNRPRLLTAALLRQKLILDYLGMQAGLDGIAIN
jgi:hypothetical protein